MGECVCEQCKHKLCASKVQIFSTLSPQELQEIVVMTGHKAYKKGQILCTEGEKSNTLYIINEGKIKLYKYTKEGKEQILHILSEGDFFGELNLFREEQLGFHVSAIAPTKICTLTKEKMDLILKKNPEITLKILKIVGERLAHVEKLVQNLATNDAEARIASLLVALMEEQGKRTAKGVEITLPSTKEDMANYLGVVRETLSRKLSKLQEEGIIEMIGNRKIIILDEDALQDLL